MPPARHRARFVALLSVVAAAVLVAGCGDSDTGSPTGGEPDGSSGAGVQPATFEGLFPPLESIQPGTPPQLTGDLSTIFGLIRERRTGPARIRLKKHLKLHPEDVQAHFLFGMTYHREKQYERARPHFEEAIRRDPMYAVPYYFYGWALYYLGDLEDARRAFRTHLAFVPDTADSHFGLGLIDLDEGRLDDAEERFRRAIALDEDKPGAEREVAKACIRLADVHVERGEFEPARDLLVRGTTLFPDHYEAYYKLYRVLLRLGEDEAAEQALADHQAVRQRVRPGTAFPE